jgi:hypothetical protein
MFVWMKPANIGASREISDNSQCTASPAHDSASPHSPFIDHRRTPPSGHDHSLHYSSETIARSVTSYSLDFGQPSPFVDCDSSLQCIPRDKSSQCVHRLDVLIVCLYLYVVVDLQCWPKVLVVYVLVICVGTLSHCVLYRVVCVLKHVITRYACVLCLLITCLFITST